mmetsp:Transcript_25440/g.63819  ORF Transcript_25440/g.63819 Transcript_25440/m.63819 type:complete len:610 (+) Transcript_25440:1381-3210(+)
MGAHTDRTHTGTAAAVRNAEGLVQVQMAHVGADVARAGERNLRVHVGAVQVHLATVLVNDLAHLFDARLEDAMSTRVGDHEGGQVVAVLLGLGAQIVHVNVAARIAAHRHHAQASHYAGGRVGAVRRHRDQAHVAVTLALGGQVLADGQHAGVLALRASVRLQCASVHTGEHGQIVFQPRHHGFVAEGLVARHERVNVGELTPAERSHLRGSVQLHGARAQRDHGGLQTEVARREQVNVAHQLGLAVIGAEGRMLQIGRLALQRRWQQGATLLQFAGGPVQRVHLGHLVGRHAGAASERVQQILQVCRPCQLVHAHRDGALVEPAQVHLTLERSGHHRVRCRLAAETHAHRVEEGAARRRVQLHLSATVGEQHRHAVDALCDRAQTIRAVIHRVEGRTVGQQRLRSADVGGGTLTADVLLARLHGHAVGGQTAQVLAHTNDASRNHALQCVRSAEEGGVWTTVAQWLTEALRRADRHVEAELARRGEQTQAQQIGAAHSHAAGGLQRFDQCTRLLRIHQLPVSARVLKECTANRLGLKVVLMLVANNQLDTTRGGPGAQYRDRLRMTVRTHKEAEVFVTPTIYTHCHGFGSSSCFIEKRGVGNWKTSEV